jgi:hypothetical protein
MRNFEANDKLGFDGLWRGFCEDTAAVLSCSLVQPGKRDGNDPVQMKGRGSTRIAIIALVAFNSIALAATVLAEPIILQKRQMMAQAAVPPNVVPKQNAIGQEAEALIQQKFCPLLQSMVAGALSEQKPGAVDTNTWPTDGWGPPLDEFLFSPKCGRAADATNRRTCTWEQNIYGQIPDLDVEYIGADTAKFGTISVLNRLVDACKIEECTFDHSASYVFERGKHLVCEPSAKKLQILTAFDSAWFLSRLSVKLTDAPGVDEP